ncbi:hypothetical protein [Cellulomonas hominis]|uniref:hypothetical protein n=1 Tax=Cellulomonas hominis TaxID=156981 RepID=UPI001B91B905|nr:hypothetical protein [Cellulomonas hominis]VTR75853.1 hypothetical protein CHMI_00606 [Cellulomonas hominis]
MCEDPTEDQAVPPARPERAGLEHAGLEHADPPEVARRQLPRQRGSLEDLPDDADGER